MKARSTLFALAALTTLSVSALAPTQASAWGLQGGYGGGFGHGYHFGGYRFGGYNTMNYFHPSYRPQYWASAPWRPAYRPTYSTPAYAPAPTVAYAPAPAPTYYAPAPVYAPAPTVAYAPPPTVTYQPTYVPQATYVAEPVAPCSGAASAPQAYAPAAQQQVYLPQQQVYVPQPQTAAPYEGNPQQQPYQDHKPAMYASTELQK
jgi:hypothetical protein